MAAFPINRIPAVLFLLLLASAPAAGGVPGPDVDVLEDGPGRIVVEVTVPEPTWDTSLPGGPQIVLPGWGLHALPDRPVVPRRVLHLAVPGGIRPDVSVEVLETRRLPRAAVPTPTVRRTTDPEAPERAGGPGLLTPGRLDPHLAWPFPATAARLLDVARLRDLWIARVEVTPLQVLDRGGAGRLARRLRVTLSWSGTAAGPPPAAGRPSGPGAFERVYRDAVLNPARATDTLEADTRSSSASLVADGVDQDGTLDGGPVLRPALTLAPAAGSTVYRLSVDEDGVHRLDGAWLAAETPDLIGRPVDQIFMQTQGVEVPIRVVDDGDGLLDAGDVIQFWGEALSGDPFDPDTWQNGDFSDVRPYFLGAAPGTRLRMSTAVTGEPLAGHAVPGSFTETVRVENDSTFLNTVADDTTDRWYDRFLIGSTPTADYPLVLPGLTSGTAALRVRLLGNLISGNLEGLHRTRLLVNGMEKDQADWDGVTVYTHGVDDGAVTFPASDLTGTSTVSVDLPLDRLDGMGAPLSNDLVWVNWLELDYPRAFEADGDLLTFEIPNVSTRLVVTGLSVADVAVLDVTPTASGVAAPLHLAAAAVSGSGPYTVTFEIEPGDVVAPSRRLAVAGIGAGRVPSGVVPHVDPQDLSGGGADWLLIGNGSLLDMSPASALNDLLALRQAEGLVTRVVTAREAYDSFTHGIEDPQAIRDLIHYALVNWSPAPVHVLLVGDATFDYKNDFGHPTPRNLLPTYMASQVGSPDLTYYSEDNRFAAVLGDNDDLQDALLGRLPTHNLAETEAAFQKIVDYGGVTPGAPWTRRAFFVSDAESGGFETSLRTSINAYFDRPENPGITDPSGPCLSSGTCRNDPAGPGPLFHTASFQALLERNPGSPPSTLAPTMKQWLLDGLDLGSGTMIFIGHGGFQNWGRDATFYRARSFAPDDVDALSNGSTPAFIMNINCITGGFHTDSKPGSATDQLYALGEDLVVTGGRGAVGLIAPSHLAFLSVIAPASNAFWDALLGTSTRQRLFGGINLTLRLKFDELGATTDLRSYAFLGDPASRLVLPDPVPPSVPEVVSGNGFVDLTWTAGDGVTFRVERSQSSPAGPYAAITAPGFASTSLSDTTVENGTVYWYRVVGIDGNGMFSSPSNDNADCPDGPGCAQAEPLNPVAPATPTGFAASDPGTGGELDLTWNAGPEDDIAFYRVSYGPEPGVYAASTKFNAALTVGELRGLDNDVPVFMVIEAVNTSGLASPPSSPPVEATPRLILGIAPPAPVTDLAVHRDLDDAVLTWSPVSSDIYGRPASVQDYRVYSSATGPFFPIADEHLLATVAEQPSPSFRHLGVLSVPDTRYYLVLTRDSAGQRSASGLALPGSVLDLQVERLLGGQLRLSWSPVLLDRAGQPATVAHYVVYGSPQPFSRADTDGMVPLVDLVTTTFVDVPEDANAYFSVLVVDPRGNVSPY